MNKPLVDWIEFDLGTAWRNSEDKTLLADEIRVAFLNLQKIYWEKKLKNDRYYDVITCWFHDGNRDCGLLLHQVSEIRKGYLKMENLSWTTLYRVFHYLQWSYAFLEIMKYI